MAFYRCGGGVDTSVVTAGASDVLSGKVIVDQNGEPLTGTMPNNGVKTVALNCGQSYTIPTGYHNVGGKVSANSLASQTSATATATNIEKGKTAWVNGKKLTGTRNITNVTIDGKETSGDLKLSKGYDIENKVQKFSTGVDNEQYRDYPAVVFNDELYTTNKIWTDNEYNMVSRSGNGVPNFIIQSRVVVYNNELHMLSRVNHKKWNGTQWKIVGNLPFDFQSGSAVVYNNEIHLLGGYGYNYHYKWNGSTWTKVTTIPSPSSNLVNTSAVVYNNEIHLFGGQADGVAHYKWNGSTWTRLNNLPQNCYCNPVFVLDGTLTIFIYYNSVTTQYIFNNGVWTAAHTLSGDVRYCGYATNEKKDCGYFAYYEHTAYYANSIYKVSRIYRKDG